MDTCVEKCVAVTGASSFIGSHVVRELLSKNYLVRGTARDPSSPKLESLKSLPNGKNLSLVKADMLQPQTFPSLLQNANALIHVATPVFIGPDGKYPFSSFEEGLEQQLKPAVEGTRALLHAAAEAGIKKVILTSSVSAISVVPTDPEVLDERCWSDEEYCRKIQRSNEGIYNLSKLLQERLAWELAESLQIKLVSINPTYVLGPVVLPSSCDSLSMLSMLLRGHGLPKHRCKEGMIPNHYHRFVDVREVAEAHVLALEREDAEGRYMLFSHYVHCADIYRLLCEHEAFRKFPERQTDSKQALRQPIPFDNSKVRKLGVREIPWQDTIRATANSLADTSSV